MEADQSSEHEEEIEKDSKQEKEVMQWVMAKA